MHYLRIATAVLVCLSAGLPAQEKTPDKAVRDAIDRGVDHLKSLQREEGAWDYLKQDRFRPGMTALAAWTLLESGVPARDPAIQKAAGFLRRVCLDRNDTYCLALAIIFFDRLAQPADRPLIHVMAARLLAGQNQHGGWSYFCATQFDREKRFRAYFQKAQKAPKVDDDPFKDSPKTTLPAEMKRLLDEIDRSPRIDEVGDNSNTQFAMLALWVARRHGLPVDKALTAVDERFRRSQHSGGTWAYNFPPSNPKEMQFSYRGRATMSCAGLLGLALGHAVKSKTAVKPAEFRADGAVKTGLGVLGVVIKNNRIIEFLDSPGDYHYFLFSLERMAVVYNLKTIQDVDWYRWGSEKLLKDQRPDGSWKGDHGGADTCFALLFLRRTTWPRT